MNDEDEEYSFHCAECQEAHFSFTQDQELRRMEKEYKVDTTGIIDLTDPNEPIEEFTMTKGNLKDGKILQSLRREYENKQ